MISVLKIQDYESNDASDHSKSFDLSDNRADYIFTVVDEIAKKTYVKKSKTFHQANLSSGWFDGGETLRNKGL